MKTIFSSILIALLFFSCDQKKEATSSVKVPEAPEQLTETALVILGTAQDAGSPQINCSKKCCANLFAENNKERKVVALGLFDKKTNQRFLIEATPDIGDQLYAFNQMLPQNEEPLIDGIFLTHAHIGHYSGLMYLGKEALGGKDIPVYTMPKMKTFLSTNGPWSQLVNGNNILLKDIFHEQSINLGTTLKVTPFLVPHRDEYSETVGYKISGPNKSALFIPDIDKWDKWDKDIIKELTTVDYAFLDATFFDAAEINHRDISEIPHPFIIESMKIFEKLDAKEKEKIHFIHFNHTNPLLEPNSPQSKEVERSGFSIARKGMRFSL